jgi:hypothetical protein
MQTTVTSIDSTLPAFSRFDLLAEEQCFLSRAISAAILIIRFLLGISSSKPASANSDFTPAQKNREE